MTSVTTSRDAARAKRSKAASSEPRTKGRVATAISNLGNRRRDFNVKTIAFAVPALLVLGAAGYEQIRPNIFPSATTRLQEESGIDGDMIISVARTADGKESSSVATFNPESREIAVVSIGNIPNSATAQRTYSILYTTVGADGKVSDPFEAAIAFTGRDESRPNTVVGFLDVKIPDGQQIFGLTLVQKARSVEKDGSVRTVDVASQGVAIKGLDAIALPTAGGN